MACAGTPFLLCYDAVSHSVSHLILSVIVLHHPQLRAVRKAQGKVHYGTFSVQEPQELNLIDYRCQSSQLTASWCHK